jgi:hypothetical protein
METIKKILNVNENDCYETYPCQHYITVELNDGTVKSILMSSTQIYKLAEKFKYTLLNKQHFNDNDTDICMDLHLLNDY